MNVEDAARLLTFDPNSETFPDVKEANTLLSSENHQAVGEVENSIA
jgi:hypothetical protein